MIKKSLLILLAYALPLMLSAQDPVYTQTVNSAKVTTVTIGGLESCADVNPMIYGQMLEDCNNAGDENPAVIKEILAVESDDVKAANTSADRDRVMILQ